MAPNFEEIEPARSVARDRFCGLQPAIAESADSCDETSSVRASDSRTTHWPYAAHSSTRKKSFRTTHTLCVSI